MTRPVETLFNDSPLLNVPPDYRPRVTLNVLSQKNWNATDLLRNDVDSTNRPPPDYIKRFKQKLIGKRVVKDEGAVQVGALGFASLSKESPSCWAAWRPI